MQQSIHSKHHFPELQEAIINGFSESFIVTANCLLVCLANPCKYYELEEVDIGPPICLSMPGTLFRVATKDGLWKGTFIDWEF